MKLTEGLFGWVDLMSTDTGAARDFYTKLFGWTADDVPTPVGVPYTQFYNAGALVAGMAPVPPNLGQMPSVWNSYVITADVDGAAERAVAAGGKVVMPVMDIMTQGRMGMFADPSGAVVGAWQPNEHQGADVFNVPCSLTWNELQTRDLAAALPFYADVFGFVWQDGPTPDYKIGTLPDKPGEDKSNCGAMSMPPDVPEGVPSFWMVYFAVEDCAAAMEAAVELGGSVLFPAMEMGPGTFGGLTDPTGAAFAVGSFPSQ